MEASWGLLEISWCIFYLDGVLRPISIVFYDDFPIRRTREKGFRYYKNTSFEPSRYFHVKWVQDAVWVPTCPHMASKNPSKSRLGGVLEPLGAVLGASWAVLEAS